VSKNHHHESDCSQPDQAKPAVETPKPEQAAPATPVASVTKAEDAHLDAPASKPCDPSDKKIKKLEADLAAAKDRELRVRAELENYRKRAARELEEHIRYAELALLRDLLPVLDNIDRAIEAAEKNTDAATLFEGFKMVSQQLNELLARHHCNRIEALHTQFDPNVHHAVMQQPSEEHPANTVLMVTQPGYQLHDRVVRPSQVIVSKPKN
jgi:molecular chaperone GrpE